MDPLQNISQPGALNPLSSSQNTGMGTGSAGTDGGLGFGDLLKQALQEVNQTSGQAEEEARNLMTGQSADMHSAMLAVQKADLSFQMMMAVRSKLIDAYREVMRMQM